MAWERVDTINEFWDHPRLGVADVRGEPHIYQCPFDEASDDYSDFYLVSPIDPELLGLVMEDWAIWIRWCEALDRGDTTRDTHPALPEDRQRHDELRVLIGPRLSASPQNCRKLSAEFRNVALGWNGVEVQWSEDS